jgi:large conductance mechanosensitive channel
VNGFRKFVLRGNVIDLAVAVVVGAAFLAVVNALVKDLITPLLGAVGGVPDFSAWYFTINGSKFLIGDFINAVVAFLILAAILYFLVILPVNTAIDRFSPATVATRECPWCLSKIPVKARRCSFCTADVQATVQSSVDQITTQQTTTRTN